MVIYILKNVRGNQIIRACDTESNAAALKANLLKTGEYEAINIEPIEVDSEFIEPLHIVKIRGELTPAGVGLKIMAINPGTTIPDTLSFNVGANSSEVSFTGFVNLTPNEMAVNDVILLTDRIKNWVKDEYRFRLTNDNPVI